MSFRVLGLPASSFQSLVGLSDAALRDRGVEVHVADEKPGFPCRVSLVDAEPGERVLLLNFEHQPAETPYRSAHAIFVREGATEAALPADTLAPVFVGRLLSVRAFDAAGAMLDADVVQGTEAAATFERLLADPRAAYLHVHNAKRGCYAARVERA